MPVSSSSSYKTVILRTEYMCSSSSTPPRHTGSQYRPQILIAVGRLSAFFTGALVITGTHTRPGGQMAFSKDSIWFKEAWIINRWCSWKFPIRAFLSFSFLPLSFPTAKSDIDSASRFPARIASIIRLPLSLSRYSKITLISWQFFHNHLFLSFRLSYQYKDYEKYGGFQMRHFTEVGRTYHNFWGNKINDYALKSCIFFKSDVLLISGRRW